MVQKYSTDWNDIQIFLHTVRHGSARATATALDISHSTVSRRIANLEKQMGTQLFHKSVSGYQLSAEGELLMSYAEQAEQAIGSAENLLLGKNNKLAGEIRVTTADAIANHLLMPTIAKFNSRYPDIDIEVLLSSQVLNLQDIDIDIALRILPIDQVPPDHLIGRIVGKIATCYYATPEYLTLNDPWENETNAKLIGWGELGKYSTVFDDSPLGHLPLTCRLNHSAMQVEAAKQHIGIAALPCFIGDNQPNLVRVSKCEPSIRHDLWMLSSLEKREVRRLRAFKEQLLDDFSAEKNKLLGL